MTTDAQRTPTDDLIHTMLRALVQSSPYTDRTHAWKSDAWTRQRAEAISAAIAWLGEVRIAAIKED